MQLSFALEASNTLPSVYDRLKAAFGSFRESARLAPLDQLIRSMIASRANDEVAWSAFYRLRTWARSWDRLIDADSAEIEAVIAPVAHADLKAVWLPEMLDRLKALKGELSLDFLVESPMEEAIGWLKTRLPGVGDKVAASVLNFSTLRRPAMVVDAHVWRVARRIGLAPRGAEPEAVRRALTEAAPTAWTDEDFFDLHWLLKRLGQTLCADSRTRCGACPVASLCEERRRSPRPGGAHNVWALRR